MLAYLRVTCVYWATTLSPPPPQVACLTRCLYWLTTRTHFSWRRAYVWNIRIFRELCNDIRILTDLCVLDKLLEYKRSWIQHVNRMPWNRLPRVMKHYSPTGRRNDGRPLKRLLDTWDRNGSTSGPTPWHMIMMMMMYMWKASEGQ